MKKKINDVDRQFILFTLLNNGIDIGVFKTAKNMDLSLEELFYDNIIESDSKSNNDVLVTSLLGVFGNYYATYYFNRLGYKTENEKPVYDKTGKVITKADVYFEDKQGISNYCEVKTAFQIIDNMRNYVDPDENSLKGKCYIDKDNEIIKYKNIGKKLLRQVSKLKTTGQKVNVIVSNGCYIDDIIKDELNNMGVNLITLNPNINSLYEYTSELVSNIRQDIKSYYNKEDNYQKIA